MFISFYIVTILIQHIYDVICKGKHSFIMLKQENVKNKFKDVLGGHHVESDITIYDKYFLLYVFYSSVSKKLGTLTRIDVGFSRSKVMYVNAWQQHMVNEGINIHWSLGTESESTRSRSRSHMITTRPRSVCYLMECPCTVDVHDSHLLVVKARLHVR